jgi:hypothetical protein
MAISLAKGVLSIMRRIFFVFVLPLLIISVLTFPSKGAVKALFFNPLTINHVEVSQGVTSRLQLRQGAALLNLATVVDANAFSLPETYGSVFNQNSSRLIINKSGQPALFHLAQLSQQIQYQETLADLFPQPIGSWQWAAKQPDTLFILANSESANQIYTLDTGSGDYKLLKDFSDLLPAGNTGSMSKSSIDDDHFAFSWRSSESASWQFVVIWDRIADQTYFFDFNAEGSKNFHEAYLDKSGKSLIVGGESFLLWRYISTPVICRADWQRPGKPCPL